MLYGVEFHHLNTVHTLYNVTTHTEGRDIQWVFATTSFPPHRTQSIIIPPETQLPEAQYQLCKVSEVPTNGSKQLARLSGLQNKTRAKISHSTQHAFPTASTFEGKKKKGTAL